MNELHEAIVAAYTRNRDELIEIGGIVDHVPPAEDVPASDWKRDHDYITGLIERHTFTWYRFTFKDDDKEEGVTMDAAPLPRDAAIESGYDVADYQERPATLQEIVDFVFSGGMQDQIDGDEAFDRGYAEARDRL